MQLVRTTLRLKENLKKEAERFAREQEVTLQEVLNKALEYYLFQEGRKKAKKIKIPTIDLGVPLDNLTRDDFYGDIPKKWRAR
jgi:hypothetical protein